MKKSTIVIITIIILSLASILLYTNINRSPQLDSSEAPVHQQLEENQAGEQDTSENTEERKPIAEEVRDAFVQGIESAVGLFVKKDLNVVAVGDSLTQGVGDGSDKGGYVGIIEETLNNNETNREVKVENYGKRGNRTDQLLKRLEKKNISSSVQEADLVLITIGANDVMKIVKENFTNLTYDDFLEEQEHYRVRLRTILTTINTLNPDAKIYLVGIFNPFDKYFSNIKEVEQIIVDWNNISENVTNEYTNATFVPIADLFQDSEENLLFKEDNFHPNEQGYMLMAERVLEYIRPEISDNSRVSAEEENKEQTYTSNN